MSNFDEARSGAVVGPETAPKLNTQRGDQESNIQPGQEGQPGGVGGDSSPGAGRAADEALKAATEPVDGQPAEP